jgi:hypothetical protein
MFKKLENNRPFLKLALEGFAGDGKTYTAAEIAIGVHKLIGSTKPIAMFDTERALKALKWRFDEAGIDAVIEDEERSLASLSGAIKWCAEGNADILIIDSITHVWEEFLRAYMNRPDRNGNPLQRTRLEFQDWGVLKPQWKAQFSTPFVMANVHIIFTGRAGYEYTDEKNEDTGKREIFKSGIKMKAETETAFEPDILVLMQKVQDLISDKKTIHREAMVVKDRTTMIDGKVFKNPTFEDFYPAIKVLLDGTLTEVHGAQIPDTFEEFEQRFGQFKKDQEIYIAEITGCFEFMGLGSGAKDKQIKVWALDKVFQVKSVEALEKVPNARLKEGLKVLKAFADEYKEYFNGCLDLAVDPDPKKVLEIMNKAKEIATNPQQNG